MSRPSINWKRAAPVAMVVGSVAAFLWYYSLYAERQAAQITDRNFRFLGLASDLIKTELNNLGVVLRSSTRVQEETPQAYIQALLGGKLSPCGPQSGPAPEPASTEPAAAAQKAPAKGYTLAYDRDEPGKILLRYSSGTQVVCGQASVDMIVSPIVGELLADVFEDVLIADETGAVIYRRNQSGNRVNNLYALLSTSPTPSASRLRASGDKGNQDQDKQARGPVEFSRLDRVDVSGTTHRIMLQPVPLVFFREGTEKPVTLVIAGLLQEERFRVESSLIPGKAAVWIFFALVLLWSISSPLMKLYWRSPFQRIRRGDPIVIALFIMAGLTATTLMILHYAKSVHTEQMQVDSNLRRLAAAIDRNLATEIYGLLGAIQSLNSTSAIMTDLQESARRAAGPDPEQNAKRVLVPVTDLLSKPVAAYGTYNPLAQAPFWYQFFDYIFWADESGLQRVKWTTNTGSTPPTSPKGFWWFHDALAGRLWRLHDPSPVHGDPSTDDSRVVLAAAPHHTAAANGKSSRSLEFLLDPLYSPNTGEYLGVLSQPVRDANLSALKARVVTIISPLASVISPVVPPNYGFAVVKADGSVLFHSASVRNGRDNIFNECGNDVTLRAAVRSQSRKLITTHYLGNSHRMLVTPFENVEEAPWTLIVFHDQSVSDALYLEINYLAAMLCVVYGAFILLGALIIRYWHPPYPGAWIWPRREFSGCYRRLTVALALMALFSGAWVFLASEDMTLAALIISILSGLFAYHALNSAHDSSELNRALNSEFDSAEIPDLNRRLQASSRALEYHRFLTAIVLVAIVLTWAALSLTQNPGTRYQRIPGPELAALGLLVLGILAAGWRLAIGSGTHLLDTWGLPQTARFVARRLPFLHRLLRPPVRYVRDWISDTNRHVCGSSGDWLFKKAKEKLTFERSYTAVLLLLLVLVSVIPAIAFYKLAHDYAHRTAMKRDQLQLAKTLLDREARLQEYYRNRLLNDGFGATRRLFLEKRLQLRIDRYDLAFLNAGTHLFTHREQPKARQYISSFLGYFSRSFPNEKIAEFAQLDHDVSSDGRWMWCLQSPTRIQLRRRAYSDGDGVDTTPAAGCAVAEHNDAFSAFQSGLPFSSGGDIQISSETPVLDSIGLRTLSALVLCLAGFYFVIWRIVQPLFLLRFAVCRVWPSTTLEFEKLKGSRLIVIGLPFSGKTHELLAQPDKVFHVDAASLKSTRSLNLASVTQPVIAVDNFESERDNRRKNRRKLLLLEKLMSLSNKRIVIVSDMDPYHYLFSDIYSRSGTHGARDRMGADAERWAKLLSRFDRFCYQPAKKGDTSSGDEFDFRLIWNTCSDSEKVTLYHLALDGWLGTGQDPGLYSLIQRGLVEMQPVPRIKNPDLRSFILAFAPAEMSTWPARTGGSIISWRAVPVWIFLALIALLGYAGMEITQTWLATVGTIVATVTAVSKLFSFTPAVGPPSQERS